MPPEPEIPEKFENGALQCCTSAFVDGQYLLRFTLIWLFCFEQA
jgi:hypothetical protein